MNLNLRIGLYCLLGGLCFTVPALGVLLWIAGGGAALLVPNPMMIATQRYIHVFEIMTQNVSLGITAVLLLRPKAGKLQAAAQTAPTPAI